MTEEFGPVMFEKIYIKEFNDLDHIEIFYNRINCFFKCLEDSRKYYKNCQKLSQKIKKKFVNVTNLNIGDFGPRLVSPPNKSLINMEVDQFIKDMKKAIECITKNHSIDNKGLKKHPPESFYI